jgi:hypothetical protein
VNPKEARRGRSFACNCYHPDMSEEQGIESSPWSVTSLLGARVWVKLVPHEMEGTIKTVVSEVQSEDVEYAVHSSEFAVMLDAGHTIHAPGSSFSRIDQEGYPPKLS